MKKIFALMMLATVFFTACSSDDDPPQKDPLTATITYQYTASADMLETVNITAKYKIADGSIVSEAVTASPWEKSISNVSVPFEMKLEIVCQAKAGYVATKDSYSFSDGYKISYVKSDGGASFKSNNSAFSVSKAMLTPFVAALESDTNVWSLSISE